MIRYRGRIIRDGEEAKIVLTNRLHFDVKVLRVFDEWGYIIHDLKRPDRWKASEKTYETEGEAWYAALRHITGQ